MTLAARTRGQPPVPGFALAAADTAPRVLVMTGGTSGCLLHSCRAAKGFLAALRGKALWPKGGGEVASSAGNQSFNQAV